MRDIGVLVEHNLWELSASIAYWDDFASCGSEVPQQVSIFAKASVQLLRSDDETKRTTSAVQMMERKT